MKTLREKTNAGLMDCKRALADTQGDLEAAVDLLRKKGAASAAKKADREAEEGVIAQAIVHNGRMGVLAELNCETDFVAKNDAFRSMADSVAHKFAENDVADVEAVQKLGESIQVRRHTRLEVQQAARGQSRKQSRKGTSKAARGQAFYAENPLTREKAARERKPQGDRLFMPKTR